MNNFSLVGGVSFAAVQLKALLDALPKLPGAIVEHVTALFGLLPSLFSVVRFAEKANLPIAVLILSMVLGVFGIAAYLGWRLRGAYGNRQLTKITAGSIRFLSESFKLSVRLFMYALFAVALLDPYAPGKPVRVPSGHRDYAICVGDNRGSGAVDDEAAAAADGNTTDGGNNESGANHSGASKVSGDSFHEKHSRLDHIRNVIRQVMNTAFARSNVALIAFQGEANIIVPMSDSPDWVLEQVDPANRFGLHVATSSPVGRGKVDGKVSRIAACLQTARKILEENGSKDHEKWIVYFGNGDDISDPAWRRDEIAKIKDENIRGAIFGVGDKESRIPIYTGDNQQFAGYYRFRGANDDALSGYNEQNLLDLAAATGWSYKHLDQKQANASDLLDEDLADWRMEIGRWHIFNYAVETGLLLYVCLAIWGRRKVKIRI